MISRNLDKARNAYKTKDIEKSIKAHSVANRESHINEQGKYIKSLTYGGLDGIITTFAVVAGVAGASLASTIVLILGFANLIADGLSMAIGDYLSTKAEKEYHVKERERELWEIEHYPEGEKKEMIEHYTHKGVSPADATLIIETLAKYKDVFADVMMAEELGMVESDESPMKNAIVTFLSFVTFGFIPLSVYVVAHFTKLGNNSFAIAIILTASTLFLLGALKSKFSTVSWIRGGFEMLFVGGIAALAAYLVGLLFG